MILNDQDITSLIKKETIKNGTEDSVEGQKYDFRLGDNFLKAKFGRTTKVSELEVEQRKEAVVEPGETVFVMTEEVLNLPKDMRLRLSPKRKIGHEGIIVLGGLDVDPGYSGSLFIGMYNFSSEPFTLHPGKKLIAGIFEKLEKPVEHIPDSLPEDTFPEDLVELIKKYQPISIQGIAEDIKGLKTRLEDMQRQLDDDNQWRKDIRARLDDLVTGLDKEIAARKADVASIKEQSGLKSDLNWKWVALVISIIAIAVSFFLGQSL